MARTVVIGSLMLACGLIASIAEVSAEAIGGFVVSSSRAARETSCVEPAETMRRRHMEFIRHQRDITVRGGVRGTKYSLSGCVACHAGYDRAGEPVPINARGQFCNACHRYAAVTLNCFDCHATIPAGEAWNRELAEHFSSPLAEHSSGSERTTP